MDPRALRSRTALHDAVLALTARTPLEALSAAEICRTAGVTRDTFYRHATNPTDLLATALSAEIEALPVRDRIDDAERDLLEHVRDRAEVYRHAMNPALAAPVRAALERVLRAGLDAWLDAHPGIAPDAVRADASARAIAVAYAAGGTVAAIEHWLQGAEGALDVESATRAILAASPEWWLRSRGHRERREP